MLAKYPGLTIVGVLGISVAVAVGTLAFIVAVALTSPTLPLDQGNRVVAIGNRDVQHNSEARFTHFYSLTVWRGALRTVTDLGAFRLPQRSVIPDGRAPSSLTVAEMTASRRSVGGPTQPKTNAKARRMSSSSVTNCGSDCSMGATISSEPSSISAPRLTP
jgi:hypothetical protein